MKSVRLNQKLRFDLQTFIRKDMIERIYSKVLLKENNNLLDKITDKIFKKFKLEEKDFITLKKFNCLTKYDYFAYKENSISFSLKSYVTTNGNYTTFPLTRSIYVVNDNEMNLWEYVNLTAKQIKMLDQMISDMQIYIQLIRPLQYIMTNVKTTNQLIKAIPELEPVIVKYFE